MATATSTPALSFDDLHRLSTDEYERIVATGALEDLRVELLEGLLIDMSPQDEPHSRAIRKLMMLFARRVDLLRIRVPLAVAEGWVPEPDVALVEHGPEGYASIVAKRGEDVLDAGVEGVEPTTVAALLKL